MMQKKEITKMKKQKENKFLQIADRFKIVLIFFLMCFILTVLKPGFLTTGNIINVFRQISIISIVAMGSTLVIISGGIDLSPGSIVALAGVCAASFALPDTYPVIVSILAGIAVGALCGLFNGIVIAKGNVPPFIVTLGTSSVARGFAYVITKGKPISGFSPAFQFIGRSNVFGIPVPVIIMFFILFITFLVMSKFVFGRHVYAVGGNAVAARVAGISVTRIKILVYTFAGITAALGGLVLASRINTGHPNSGTGYELDAIAATVIGGTGLNGGTGTVTGTLIGALIIGVLNNGLDILGVPSYYQQICKGFIIIITVLIDKKNDKND
jgi:inositol transport system permease protein